MAADQRRKRLNGASIVGYGYREQHRTKRKNLGPVQNDLSMKSHICVEWDANQKRVVAKREQIGISWRHMKPFVNFVSKDHKVLADVFTIPQEIFDLDNLSEVLSYEVWKTHISENERNCLMHFLPSGLEEPHQTVEELLAGNNFHFGNPFLKWGASLCLGELHPDVIVDRELHLMSEKRAYYSQLHNYHNDMIGFLIKLKKRWQSCKDPEKEILQKIWRSKNVEKRMLSNVNESRVYDHDGNVTVTSESCSWDAEEKACGSDNQISSLRKDDKLQKRVLEKGIVKGKTGNLIVSSHDMLNVGEKPKKGELPKRNIHSSDGDKYMSCIKISKQQHELVKSMKQSGKSIQSRSLNRVLGNLDNIHVQPYEVFVEEEQKKLHEHWLQLVNKDLPAAYANWTGRQIQRHAVRNSLVAEMKDKSNPLLEEEDNVSSGSELQDQDEDNVSSGDELQDQDQDTTSSGGELQDQDEDNVNSGSKLQNQDEDNVSSGNELQDQAEDAGLNDQSSSIDDGDSIVRSTENQSLHNYLRDESFNPMSMGSEKNLVSSKPDDASLNKAEYSRNMNTQDVSVNEGAPFASGGDVWQAVAMPHPYYGSVVTHEYTVSGLSTANPQFNEEQQTHLIDVQADLRQQETGKELLHRQLGDGTFSSYQSQDRSDFLQSLFKGEGMLSYHPEQKGDELDFRTSNNVMMGDGQYSSHFKEPLQTSLTLDQGHRRASEVFLPENMSETIYSDRGRYLISRRHPLASVNMADWAANTASIAASSQSHLNTGGFIGHHWFPADHVRGGWNGSDGSSLSSQSVGTGSNSDQSLFGILSQCSQLRPGSPYGSIRNTDQFLAPRTYGELDAGTPRISVVVPQASHTLGYFSGRETPSGLVPDDMARMSLPHQNSALHDQMGKSYLRSWNRGDARSIGQLERQSSFPRSQDREINLLTMDNEFRCIDICKQPAFEHPLLKNHKIQLTPTFAIDAPRRRIPNIGKGFNVDNFTKECPPGKVFIHMINTRHQMNTEFSSELEIKDFHQHSQSYPGHHFATLDTTQNTTFHGASARFNVYNISVYANQYSISQMWLQSGPPTELNSIQVGWGEHPSLYGDNAIRLTAYWTVDNYKKTGCFDYLCPGFVQVDNSIHLGAVTNPVSVIGSYEKHGISTKVIQDQSSGHWWLIVLGIQVGYWPKEIFTHLRDGSSLIRFGDETFSPTYISSPPMGSGELPQKLFLNSAYIAQLKIVDSDYNENAADPEHMKSYCDTSSNCYDMLYHGYEGQFYEQAFLFGGPGGQCGI